MTETVVGVDPAIELVTDQRAVGEPCYPDVGLPDPGCTPDVFPPDPIPCYPDYGDACIPDLVEPDPGPGPN